MVIGDALGHHDILRKSAGAAKVSAGDANHLAVIAQIDIALETELALAAVDGGVERHPIASLELAYIAACRGDHPGCLVAHNDGRNPPAGSAVVAVDITAADATGGDAHQNLVRARYGRGKIRDVELIVFREKKSFHGGNKVTWLGLASSSKGCTCTIIQAAILPHEHTES